MEMYEVQLCPHRRWDRQQARIVPARDEEEAAYKVTGERLRKDGDSKEGPPAGRAAWQRQPPTNRILRAVRSSLFPNKIGARPSLMPFIGELRAEMQIRFAKPL
jgi:hypothetical protein